MTRFSQPCISIIFPAYQEEKNILYIYQKLLWVLLAMESEYNFEIIIVNDGSIDNTGVEIEKLCQFDKRVKAIHLSRNFGKEIAITAGLEYSSGAAVITLDADGQHPVEKIPDFIEKWKEGYDIVYNRRPEIHGASFMKKMTSRIFNILFTVISDSKLEAQTSDYHLLDRVVVDAYLRFREKNRVYRGLVDWLGFKKIALEFDAQERVHGEASYTYSKLIRLAINNITSFSFFPLKFVGYMGFGITVFASGILMLQILDKLGFIYLNFSNLGIVIVLNTILIGIVLMSLGLIGIYIANIHEEVVGRPLYVVKKYSNFK